MVPEYEDLSGIEGLSRNVDVVVRTNETREMIFDCRGLVDSNLRKNRQAPRMTATHYLSQTAHLLQTLLRDETTYLSLHSKAN